MQKLLLLFFVVIFFVPNLYAGGDTLYSESDKQQLRLLWDTQARDNGTLLHKAAARGCYKEVQDLLQQNHDVNARDLSGRTPLFRAAQGGHGDVIELLLNNGADSTIMDNNNLLPVDVDQQCRKVKIFLIDATLRRLALGIWAFTQEEVKAFKERGRKQFPVIIYSIPVRNTDFECMGSDDQKNGS